MGCLRRNHGHRAGGGGVGTVARPGLLVRVADLGGHQPGTNAADEWAAGTLSSKSLILSHG